MVVVIALAVVVSVAVVIGVAVGPAIASVVGLLIMVVIGVSFMLLLATIESPQPRQQGRQRLVMDGLCPRGVGRRARHIAMADVGRSEIGCSGGRMRSRRPNHRSEVLGAA